MKEFVSSYIKHNIPFWILMGVAIFLLVISLFIPPLGKIDSSVIAGVGELFGFAALWAVALAIEKGTTATAKHGNTEITVHSIDEQK